MASFPFPLSLLCNSHNTLKPKKKWNTISLTYFLSFWQKVFALKAKYVEISWNQSKNSKNYVKSSIIWLVEVLASICYLIFWLNHKIIFLSRNEYWVHTLGSLIDMAPRLFIFWKKSYLHSLIRYPTIIDFEFFPKKLSFFTKWGYILKKILPPFSYYISHAYFTFYICQTPRIFNTPLLFDTLEY